MAQANEPSKRGDSGRDSTGPVLKELPSGVRRLSGMFFRQVSFWGAIVLPFVALALLVTQPPWWPTLLVVVFLINGVAVYAGHCHGMEC